MDDDSEKPWRDTYKRLMALDKGWEKPRFRAAAIKALRAFLGTRCAGVPHLAPLARLAREGMTRQDLFALIVPCERALRRTKVTDADILSADLPPDVEPAPKMPLTVIADNFRSAINVGTLFRVCDCFGVQEAVLCGYTPSPDDGRAKQAALGAEAWVPWSHAARTLEAVRAKQVKGVRVIALETVAGAPTLETWRWAFPCAVALGSERFGLGPDVVRACDAVMRIPMYGRKNSLNVVMAFTLVAHAARQAWETGSAEGVGAPA